MTKNDKINAVAELKEKFSNSNVFYLTDSSTLTVAEINDLRRKCYEKGIEIRVVKNTLVKKALEQLDGDYEDLYQSLKGPTTLMFAEVGNLPAKLLEEYRKERKPKDDIDRPILKAAYIDSAVYTGDGELKTLTSIKSKEDLIAEVIALLQSPAKNVVSALQSSGNKLAGIIKTLSEREG